MRTTFALLAATALLAAGAARAQAPAGRAPVTVTGVRSWSSPAGTRVVFEFTQPVTPVAPDSGATRELYVSVPGVTLQRGANVPVVRGIRDGLVDSVLVAAGADGGGLRLWFHDTSRFRVSQVRADADKPFRLVIDVARNGAPLADAAPPVATLSTTPAPTSPAAPPPIAQVPPSHRGDHVRVVIVDPGHGGEDSGAHGPRGVLEKWTNLGVARALVDELNHIGGIRASLTRDGDTFIPLRERYHIAERAKADLFISIHANSSPRRGGGSGTEVYFLSLRGASDQASKDLAGSENAADLVGGVPPKAEDDLVGILYDVKRSSALQQSQLLAETLLDHLTADRRLEGRGIKQAGFVVLKSVEFPSVLVETAFINNPTEARLLSDPTFQRQLGHQLAEGVRIYFQKSGVGLSGPGDGSSLNATQGH